ncbi:MAG: hypothetical protein AVDCRST_MAG43-779, partial [uncultured Thermomicrobiales bacterium]
GHQPGPLWKVGRRRLPESPAPGGSRDRRRVAGRRDSRRGHAGPV